MLCLLYVLSLVAGNTKVRYLVWHEQRAQCSQLHSKILYVLKIKSHNQGCKYPAKCACNTTVVSKLHDAHGYIYILIMSMIILLYNKYVCNLKWLNVFLR